MKGKIFRIKRFSVHDGPGIRTSVFLKGCPLNCIWCHNPEGISSEITVWHNSNICISCRLCTTVCPAKAIEVNAAENKVDIDRVKCLDTGECAKICPSHALQLTGITLAETEIIKEIIKDITFYEISGGGITLTGGEPLYQPDFSASILMACKERNIHTAIETCLFASWENINNLLECTDLFITDLKIFDAESHRKFTGKSNELILNNFRRLSDSGKQIIVRVPMIKDITDTPENIEMIKNFVNKNRIDIPIEYIIFNPLTRNNYDRLGIQFLL